MQDRVDHDQSLKALVFLAYCLLKAEGVKHKFGASSMSEGLDVSEDVPTVTPTRCHADSTDSLSSSNAHQ